MISNSDTNILIALKAFPLLLTFSPYHRFKTFRGDFLTARCKPCPRTATKTKRRAVAILLLLTDQGLMAMKPTMD